MTIIFGKQKNQRQRSLASGTFRWGAQEKRPLQLLYQGFWFQKINL